MENSKIIKARQLKKNEALNAIRKVFNPKFKFPYEQGNPWGDWDDMPSLAEQREKYIANIIDKLERDLADLKVDVS